MRKLESMRRCVVRRFGRLARDSAVGYGWSQEDDEGGDDDDEVVRRPGWSDAQMAESPRGLAARWAACGLEMDDELSHGRAERGGS